MGIICLHDGVKQRLEAIIPKLGISRSPWNTTSLHELYVFYYLVTYA